MNTIWQYIVSINERITQKHARKLSTAMHLVGSLLHANV